MSFGLKKGVLKVKQTETVYDYWRLTCPMNCRKCECAVMDWSFEGDPKWGCELEKCYHGSEQTASTEVDV